MKHEDAAGRLVEGHFRLRFIFHGNDLLFATNQY